MRKMIPKIDLSNMGESLTMFVIDVKGNDAGEDIICNSLDSFYKKIGCDCVDISTHRLEDKTIWVICETDDRESAKGKVSALNKKDEPSHYGTLLIAGYCKGALGRPMMRSLTKDEMEMVYRHLGIIRVPSERYNSYCIMDLEDIND